MELRENQRIAMRLREAADRLEALGQSRFRAAAYRRAAASVEASPRSMRTIYERHGRTGLDELPGVGPGIAGAIAEMLTSGRWKYLERLSTERAIAYIDKKGVERECLVLEAHPHSSLHGRDAIAALLARKSA
jgi:DNA polymerase/3'-5' exonuclease PolX